MINILSRLVDHLPVGVIVLDQAGRAVVYNRVEELLAGRSRVDVLGTDFFRAHGVCMDVPELAGVFREQLGRRDFLVEVDVSFPFPLLATPREVRVSLSSFEANTQPYGLLVLRDVSHEQSVSLMRETLNQMLMHDLKNPLAAVVANLEFLEGSIRDPADAREAIADALASSARLEAMMLTLVDVSRLETNTFPLSYRTVDVAQLATAAVDLQRAVVRAKTASLTVKAPQPVSAEVDPDLVQRLIDNLVANALRYAHRVEVTVTASADDVVVEVADDGPGVPPLLRERIFEKFEQVAQPGQLATRGSNRGLGLTFVRFAARAHGGEVSAHQASLGGALFRVVLPRARVRPPRLASPDEG